MDNNYDSILKEKKVYVEESVSYEHSAFKKFLIFGLFISLIVIFISYFVYYNSVLSGESILLNNILKLVNKYEVISEGVKFNYDLGSKYMLDGNISVDGYKYNYSFIKDGNKKKRMINKNNLEYIYYYDSDSAYVKLSSLGDNYISVKNELYSVDNYSEDYNKLKNDFYNYFSTVLLDDSALDFYNKLYNLDNYSLLIENITNNFSNYIDDSKYKKKFYFNNGRPVVNINLILNTKDINKILGDGDNNLIFKDDIKISITTMNDAILNNINNIKIVINNNTKNSRVVFRYDGNNIIYTSDDGVKYKYKISKKGNNSSLKVYKDDVLYSVLELTKDGSKYIYNYQVIDMLKRYGLEVEYKKDNYYIYRLSSNVNNNINSIVIDGTYYDDGAIEENINSVVNYRELSDKDKNILNSSINKLFGK